MRHGILNVSDGPAVNADMFLTGYFLIEVESFETAIELGRTHSERANWIGRSLAGDGYRLVGTQLPVPVEATKSHGWARVAAYLWGCAGSSARPVLHLSVAERVGVRGRVGCIYSISRGGRFVCVG
jgi:hypothetical protein